MITSFINFEIPSYLLEKDNLQKFRLKAHEAEKTVSTEYVG